MKIINKNAYKIMFEDKFIRPEEVIEMVDQRLLKILLNQPGIEEYVDVTELKKIEKENKKLKEQLAKNQQKSKTSKSK